MPTWMAVEDEPDIYDLLLAMFAAWGIEGVAFVDGLEAIAWIDEVDQGRIRGELPELAMIDVRLLDIGGEEVGARIRRSPVLHDIAIVMITAYKLSPAQEKAVIDRAQADLYLQKPLPPMAQLREQLDAIIAKHGGPDLSAIRVSTPAKAAGERERTNGAAKKRPPQPPPAKPTATPPDPKTWTRKPSPSGTQQKKNGD